MDHPTPPNPRTNPADPIDEEDPGETAEKSSTESSGSSEQEHPGMTYQPATRHTKPATGDTETGLEKGS